MNDEQFITLALVMLVLTVVITCVCVVLSHVQGTA